jgi:hypothetical protein
VAYYVQEIPWGNESTIDLRDLPVMTGITVGTTFLGLVLGTLLMPSSPQRQDEIRRFLEGMESVEEEDFGDLESSSSFSPASIIGTAVALLGVLAVAAALISPLVSEIAFREIGLTLCVGVVMALIGLACWKLAPKND